MVSPRSVYRQLRELVLARTSKSLSASIVIALCAGLLLPVFSGGLLVTALRQSQQASELASFAEDKVSLLANSLNGPMWNLDLDGMRAIVEAVMLDRQVVRISIRDNEGVSLLRIEHPDRRIGKVWTSNEPLIRNGSPIGSVEIEIDDGLRMIESARDRRFAFLIFSGQFLLALVLILAAMRKRVLRPLSRLVAFSNQIADGNLDQPIGWQQSDEIGRLALQLDTMRQHLRSSFAEQEAILDSVPVGVVFTRNRVIELANRQLERILGYAPGELLGQGSRVLYVSDEQYATVGALAYGDESLRRGLFETELQLKRKDGSLFWARMRGSIFDNTSPQKGSIWVFEDITEQRRAEQEIERLAFYDALTGLPNRRLMLDRLDRALTNCVRHRRHAALLITDLDNFKTLNDTLGHYMGDQLLREAASRLERCVRKSDTVARMGGDEFLIILEDLDGEGTAAMQAESIARKIQERLSHPFLLQNELPGQAAVTNVHRCTSSTGIAMFNDDSLSGEELMKRADTAMYQAKAAGRNTLRFFDPDMQAAVAARAILEADLRRATDEEEFVLAYQPQVNSRNRIIGAEALLRWQHPDRGLVLPGEFIGVAEETGFIIPIGRWVVERACEQLSVWSRHPSTADLTLAINVSARQFHHADFVNQIVEAIERYDAKPHLLKLEITESMLLGDINDVIRIMNSLKNRGICFSLDDFGTGYSSLYYLKRLPLDQLKIDRSFVNDILTDTNDATIARSIVALANSLGLSVIAEGVETSAQREFLEQSGCLMYQGYLFSRPLLLAEFEHLLARPLDSSTLQDKHP